MSIDQARTIAQIPLMALNIRIVQNAKLKLGDILLVNPIISADKIFIIPQIILPKEIRITNSQKVLNPKNQESNSSNSQ
jgi:hypothetical protein